MNEQALQQLYRLAKGEGYQKGYNDFKNLMATNEQAIGNMYEISRMEGYQKSIDDFKVLVGFDVKKKDDSQPTLETEVTTESTTEEVQGEDISSDSVFEYDLTETEKIKAEEEAKAKAGEYDFKPTEFDPSTLPKEPLVKDAYPGLFQGESAFTDRVADKLARKYNKAGENVEEVFPDMYKDVFEEVRDERKFIESYDELPEEVKTRIEPGVVRENGQVIGVNQSLIPNQNIEEIVKLYETEEIGDAGLQSGLIENFADVIENQKREDYSIKIKKVGQLQEDIKNTKEKITQLQEQGNNLLADQLSIPLNETIEEYNNLIKESNEDGILINSLDIISENEDMLAPLSGVSSAASELVARTASALPVVFGTLASVAGKLGFMTPAQAKVVSQSLMQDALKLEDEVRDFFPKDYRDKKMNFTGEVVGQIGFIVGSGVFLGGTPAVVAAGYTMSASEMYREATNSGLSHEDAMNLSMAYGAISAPLEMWGASRGIEALAGKSLRKKVLNEILESGAKGFTKEAAEKAIKVSYKPILTETLKESAEEGIQEFSQFLLSKGLAEAYNATKDEDKPEFIKASIKSKEFWSQAWDNFLAGTIGGGIGGVSLNVAGGNIFVGNDYKAIEKMFTDPKQMAKVDAQLNSYRKTGKIETDEELQAAKEQVGIVSQAAAEVRNATKTNRITVGNQKQLFKLTAERISLQKETEGVTVPSLIADKKQRIEELDKNIQDIIAGKVVQPLETQETAPKVTTEGIEDAEVEEEVDEKVVNETKRVDNIFNETNPEVAETLLDNLVRNKSAEFELSSIGQSIVNQATKAAVAIQRVAPNVRVVLHDTSKEYTDFGKEGTRGSYDPATKTIHIDLSKANKRTIGHETFHSILLESIKSDVELQKLTDDMYKTVNRSLATNPFLKRKLRKFSEKYADNIRSEEALSELFGMLSSDYKKLSAPVKIKIKQFVNKVATKFGLGDIIKLSEQDLSDIDTIDLLNTMATRVKEGEAITEEETKPLTDRDVEGGKYMENPISALKRNQVGDFEVSYTEQENIESYLKDGRVTQPKDVSFLEGLFTTITSPDDMLAGQIKHKGKVIFEGEGGLFFVTKFGDVWASGKVGTANTIANNLNKQLKENNGRAFLTLTKGTDSKLVSSASGVNSTLAVLNTMLDSGLISPSLFRESVSSSVKKAKGSINLRQSAKDLKKDIEKYFTNPKTSTFEKRGFVVKDIVSYIASNLDKSKKKDIVSFLGGDLSKGLGVGNTAKSQALVDLIAKVASEKLTKGLSTGDVYAVIEINSEVEVKEDSHPSYPFHISLKDGSAPILHLPKNREPGSKTIVQKGADGKYNLDYAVRNVSVVEGKYDFVSAKTAIEEGLKRRKSKKTTRAVREQKDEVVYHGSPTPIEGGVLKRGQSGAIFLTPNRKYAEQYSMDKVGEVTEIKISEQKKENLFDLRKPEHVEKLKEGFLKNNEELEIEYDTKEDALRDYDNAMRSMKEASKGREGINDWSSGSQFIEAMENAGFEGALFAERPAGIVDENIVISYALFDKQIPIEEISSENDTTRAVREQKVDSKSFKNILSKITNITKIDLKEQIQIAKDLKKRARLTKKEKKILDDSLRDTLNELQGQGKLTTFQVKAVLRKFQNVDVFSTSQVESFVDYMTKVFADADYLAKIRDADAKLPKARNNIKKGKTGINEVGPLLSKLFRINPRLIPSQFLDKYLEIVDTLSKRKKELELDLESITKNTEEILNYMDSEFSKVNWLASGFEDYVAENKSKVKGKTFTEIVSLMKEDGVIDDSDVAIMKKYKSIISPTKKTTKTEQEIQEEKDELIKGIKENSKEKNPIFSTNEELALAKQLKELINTKGIEELSTNELKTLLQVINNINQGLVTNNAFLLKLKLDSLKNTSPVKKSILNGTIGAIEKRYNKVKTGLLKVAGRKKNYIQRTLESNPLYYIDLVFGDGKSKNLYDSLFRGMAEGEQKYTYDIKKYYEQVDNARDAVKKSFKGSENKTIESSAKQFFYMLELEYNSNEDKTKVKKASEYLDKTIDLAKVDKRDIDMLEKIKEAYVVDGKVDMDKLYSSFNSAEKKSIKVAQEINQSLAPQALFVAGVITGQKINLLKNYVHHVVVSERFEGDVIDDSHKLMDSMNQNLKPSTKAKSTIERQNVVTALNFDIYNSVKRGSKSTLLDFHLTAPIKTARATLKETKKALEKDGSYKSKKDIYEAIDSLVENTISNFIYNSVASSGIIDKGLSAIVRISYQRVLADSKRYTQEVLSNFSYILNKGRKEWALGVTKYRDVSSETMAKAMRNLGSLQTDRVYGDSNLKSRFTEKIFEDKLGIRGRQNRSKVMDVLGSINYYSLKPLANVADTVGATIISSPDQIMNRPLIKGTFASTFEQETGESFPEDGFERIAANDQAFMSKYKNALKISMKKSDDVSIEAGASSGMFTGISKGKDAARQKGMEGFVKKFFYNYNDYMNTFLNYEFQAFRKGLMAAKGNGMISEKEGRQLMAAVATRMTLYSLLAAIIPYGAVGVIRRLLGYAEGEDEEEKSILKKGGQAIVQTGVGLLVGRNFGNLTKQIQNSLVIEPINEKYLGFLRDGDYDKYKDKLGYTLSPKVKEYEDAKVSDYLYTFSGPYSKLLTFGDKALKITDDILEPSKKADAKKREKQRLKRFVFFEIPALLGYVPIAKEVEKELNSFMYKDFRKGGKSKWIDVGPTEAEEKKAFKQIDPEGYKEIYGK